MGWAKKLAAAGVLLVGAKLALAGGAGEALAGMVNEALGGRMVSASIDLELGPRAAEETALASDPVYPSIVLDPSPSPEAAEEPEPDDGGEEAGNIVETTIYSGLSIKNSTSYDIDVGELVKLGPSQSLPAEGPQILIVHTHGSEAYTMPKGQEYAPTGTCRTADNSVNMIRVGDEIAAVLSSYGISVLHDRVLYDDPAYDGAYERAADAIRGYLEKYPTLSFVLDVHRDAIEDKAGHQYKVITREDPSCAQISFVMGSNNDHWLENVKLAVAIQQRLTDTSPTLMRPMTLRNSNYNQHLTTGSMLVEIGTAGNSLSEALRAAQLFAMGFAQVVTEK